MNTSGPTSLIAAVLFLAPAVASAQVSSPSSLLPTKGTAHIVEWDLSQLDGEIDANPGAIFVDTRGFDHNRVWFVTRASGVDGQRVYRFDPFPSLMKGNATWRSWNLRPDAVAGGSKIRPSYDRRYVFVRTPQFVQRIDTQNCVTAYAATCRTVWTPADVNFPLFVSDISLDDRNRIFTSGISGTTVDDPGYVQMIDPAAAIHAADPNLPAPADTLPFVFATRWAVGNGTGACVSPSGIIGICNAGIEVHPTKQYLVYYVEPAGFIAELNVSIDASSPTPPLDVYGKPITNVRRWSLADLAAASCYSGQGCEEIAQPRTLKIDRSGKVWINTGTGHLVSLDPDTNRMTKHQVPVPPQINDASSVNDLWGVAPDDDVVGYTATGTNKVAMLFPKFTPVTVKPAKAFAPSTPIPVAVQNETAIARTGSTPGDPKIVQALTTRGNDGTYVEALIDTSSPTVGSGPSLEPLGITPNRSKAQGTFFYTVGFTGTIDNPAIAKRIGFARLPNKEKIRNARDDDDADDGYDAATHPGWHNSEPGDYDADGVPDQYDTNTSTDNMTIGDPLVVPVGSSSDYPVSTSATTLALIASVTPDVATATIAVDVYNAAGTLVGTSGPVVGAGVATIPSPGAGNYKIRVRNLGTSSVSPTPTVVVREPPIIQ
jgi:hypothetical protein